MTQFSVASHDMNFGMITAACVALAASIIAGPLVIRWLKPGHRERIVSDSARLNELHAAKRDTPTMGGLLIVAALIVGAVPHLRFDSGFVWLVFFVTLTLTAVGACDDWIKLKTSRNGLTVRQKLAAQVFIALLAAVALFLLSDPSPADADAMNPIVLQILSSGWFMIPWAAIVIIGTSNAVNLTDGLDGLAAGCTVITGTALAMIFARFADSGSTTAREAAVFSASLSGSALGFLSFNRYPARIFMGDTGSLPIGGVLAVTALACHAELMLLVTGAVFVVETLSVILQVCWYRRTGRRILLCSPLHNHFVFRGKREPRIVAAFWTCAAICSAIGLLLSH